jgi:hypothetical protein
LARLKALHPESAADPRRFRPNIVIDMAAIEGSFPETEWIGRKLAIGDLRLTIPSRAADAASRSSPRMFRSRSGNPAHLVRQRPQPASTAPSIGPRQWLSARVRSFCLASAYVVSARTAKHEQLIGLAH